MCAFDLPERRSATPRCGCLREEHVIVLPCGEQTIRFRPTLDVTEQDLAFGLAALDRVLAARCIAWLELTTS